MVQRLPLAIVLAALALLSIASSAALIVSLLHPSHAHQRLLPAQRLQLLLASLDIAIVFASAASLCDVVFRHSQPPPSPLSDAPTTFALCLCLLLRPAIVCAFATNSFATIWLDRSAASRLKLFLPPSLAAVFVSAACALVTGIYGDGAAYDSGMTIGQTVTSAWTISCVALLAIVTTLAIGGIIWAVWASSQQQGGHNRNSNRLLGFPPSPRPHEPRGAIAEHRELEPILMQPVAATRTEFGVIPPKASVHTFGHGRPIGSLDTGRRIDQALQGTLCRSEQTATTLANWGGAGAPVATTLASTLDAYDSYSRRDAQGSGIDGDAHRDLDQTASTTAAAAADFSIQHAYDHAFDGTSASPEPSFSREAPDSDTRAPSGILRPTISPQIGRTTGSDRSRRLAARASRLSTCSHSEALLRRVRSTGFVLVDSDRLRRDAAGQGFDESSASVASAAAASARHVTDIEKGGVGQDQPCLSPSSDSAPATTLSRTEALKALSRLTGLILSVWLPFAFSLPFLTNGWTHDTRQTTSAATVVLLCLGLTLTSPLMVLQRFVAYLLEKRRLRAMREGSRNRRRAHTPPLDPSHGRDWSISTSGPVAGVGYGDCNGYDHGLLDQASAVHPRSSPAASSSQAGPIRFSSTDTFGAAVHRPSAVLNHQTGSVRSRSGAKRSSSVKSVAYSDRHWAGRRGSGDRVEPRGPFWRAVNLMLSPHPRLEVLPQDDGRASDDTAARAVHRASHASRPSMLPHSSDQPTLGVNGHPAEPAGTRTNKDPQPGRDLLMPASSGSWHRSDTSLSDLSAVEGDERRSHELAGLLSSRQRRASLSGSVQGDGSAKLEGHHDHHHAGTLAPDDTALDPLQCEPVEDRQAGWASAGMATLEPRPSFERDRSMSTMASQADPPSRSQARQEEAQTDAGIDIDLSLQPMSTSPTAEKHQTRMTMAEFLQDDTAVSEQESPGQARAHPSSFSGSDVVGASPSSHQSTPGSIGIAARASLSISNSPVGDMLAHLSESAKRRKIRSTISDAMALRSPSYMVLEDLVDDYSRRRDHRDGEQPAEQHSPTSAAIPADTGSERNGVRDDLDNTRRRRSMASDVGRAIKTKLSLAKSLGLSNSRRSTASSPGSKTMLGEAMGLQAMPKRPLSAELGLERTSKANKEGAAASDTSYAASTIGAATATAIAATPWTLGHARSPGESTSSSHRRQDTLGSISVLSSCLSEEIVISPDPSPQKPREVEHVGLEPEVPPCLVPPAGLGEPLEAVAEEEDHLHDDEESHSARQDEGSSSSAAGIVGIYGSGVPLDRNPLSFFREHFPVRILSPVLEATEDTSWGARSRVASLLSLSPVSAWGRSVGGTPVRGDDALSLASNLQHSATHGDRGSPASRAGGSPIKAALLQRMLLRQVHRQGTPEGRLSLVLGGAGGDDADEGQRLGSLQLLVRGGSTIAAGAAAAEATPRRTPASLRLRELSFDSSVWQRSPPSLELSMPEPAVAHDDAVPRTPAEDSWQGGGGLAAGRVQASPTDSRRTKGKRRSTSSLQLLASSGAAAVSGWKDVRRRSAASGDTSDGTVKRRSVLSTPLGELRLKLKKLERRSSLLGRGASGERFGTMTLADQVRRPKKPRKARGRVAVMIERHQFCVVDDDDSFVKIVRAPGGEAARP